MEVVLTLHFFKLDSCFTIYVSSWSDVHVQNNKTIFLLCIGCLLNQTINVGLSTSTALQWYIIVGTTPKPLLRSRPTCQYTHYNKARHEFLTSSPNKRSIRDETQRNRINCMRLTSPKVLLSKTIHDWIHPLRIVPYRAIIYAFFSKRAQMTVTWFNFVNNTLIASRQAYRRSRYCLQNWTR